MSDWISVEDRLPDDDVDVLIHGGTFGVGYREDDTWYELLPWTKSPTHWMPLPEPPVAEDK